MDNTEMFEFWKGGRERMEAVLRRLNPETGLYDYMFASEHLNASGDGWALCYDSIWDVQKMEDGYMVVLYEFDDNSNCMCSSAFDVYPTIEEAKQAIIKEQERYYQ